MSPRSRKDLERALEGLASARTVAERYVAAVEAMFA